MTARDNLNKKLPPLTKRMQAILSLVSRCRTAADIGCDHGYVCIALCKSGRCSFGIASDIRPQPAQTAQKNVSVYGISDSVEVRTGSGLKTLKKDEADVIIISGMGAETILSILKESPEHVQSAKELVLGPQSEAYKVREYLSSINMRIDEEKLIEEDGKYYSLLRAVHTKERIRLSKEEALFGPVLIRNKDAVLHEFLTRRLADLKMITDGIENHSGECENERTKHRRTELLQEAQLIQKVLDMYDKRIPFILASASPRRSELLKQIGIEPIIRPADVNEDIGLKDPKELVLALSKRKCEAAAQQALSDPDYGKAAIVAAADTVVALNDKIFGKPADEKEAFLMLRELSGSEHEVLTGVCICRIENREILSKRSFAESTRVRICDMTDDEIRSYIASGEPFDKAGAYAIQGLFGKYVSGITGNYANVVGLPISSLYHELKGMTDELW